MKLNKEYFLFLLKHLKKSDTEIKATSKYILFSENDIETILEGINFIYLKSSIHHHLLLYYLIFEIYKKTANEELKEKLKEFIKIKFIRDVSESKKTGKLLKDYDGIKKVFLNKEIL